MEKNKIVLVEDDEFLSGMYETKLTQSGYEVKIAADGAAGLKMITDAPPDIVLLDILLPEMDGFEVLAELRKNAKTKKTPVILLTNLGQKEDVDRGMSLGANGYLIKAHFTPSEVVAKIKETLNS
jgi:two-component system, OmpR family, alkaline phosphatase synthesis response regulator PhoP